jgi:hypothetical protein
MGSRSGVPGFHFASRRMPAARFFLSGASHVVALAALEERLAARVHIQRRELVVEEYVDAHVRIARIHARPASGGAAEMVGDGVLHPQRDEVEALHRAAVRVRVHLEGAVGVEVMAPLHGVRAVVDVVLGLV